MIPKNIFFYWSNVDNSDYVPEDIINNINNYKKIYSDYNVILLNDSYMDKYKSDFPELLSIFHLITIPSFKSDIVRNIILYEEGGIWLDCNTTQYNNNAINIVYDIYKDYDAVFTILPNYEEKIYHFYVGVLLSTQKSKLFYDAIQLMTQKTLDHYNLEKESIEYVPYSYYLFIPPTVFNDLLEYDYSIPFEKEEDLIKNEKGFIVSVNSKKYQEYNCGVLMTHSVDYGLFRFYGIDNIKERGDTNHWSNLQKRQKLFRCDTI